MEYAKLRAVIGWQSILLSLVLVGFWGSFYITHAQFSVGQTSMLELSVGPKSPAPHSQTIVSVNDSNVDMIGSDIRWYVDEIERINDRNKRSINVTVGGLGESTRVRAVLSRSSGATLQASLTLSPVAVEIIIEADTYIPSFYLGRALPSSESNVRAIAVVHTGSASSPSSYTYKWSENDSVFFGGPVKGKREVEFSMPRYATKRLSVEVYNDGGGLVGSKSILLNTIPPEIHFYEFSPLRGLSQRELVSPSPLLSEETTIFGEPYYLNTSLDDRYASFDWVVDGQKISQGDGAPNELLLQRTGVSGKSNINLTITTLARIPQYVNNSFQVFFE